MIVALFRLLFAFLGALLAIVFLGSLWRGLLGRGRRPPVSGKNNRTTRQAGAGSRGRGFGFAEDDVLDVPSRDVDENRD